MHVFEHGFLDALHHEEQHPVVAPPSLCFLAISAAPYFPVLLLQWPMCAWQHLDLEHMSCCRVPNCFSTLWAPANPGTSPDSLSSCCLLLRGLSFGIHPLQKMQHREQTLCQCRQVASLFSHKGVLLISPKSTLFLAFSNSHNCWLSILFQVFDF